MSPESTAQAAAPTAKPCNYCGKKIVWTKTEKGGRMPLDAAPDTNGNVLIYMHAGEAISAVVAKKARLDAIRAQGTPMYLHHKLSCPRASEWQRSIA